MPFDVPDEFAPSGTDQGGLLRLSNAEPDSAFAPVDSYGDGKVHLPNGVFALNQMLPKPAKNVRYALHGIRVECRDGVAHAVVTDGRTLLVADWGGTSLGGVVEGGDFAVTAPGESWREGARLASNGPASMEVEGGQAVRVRGTNKNGRSKLVEDSPLNGRFPTWTNIDNPKNSMEAVSPTARVVVNAKLLAKLLLTTAQAAGTDYIELGIRGPGVVVPVQAVGREVTARGYIMPQTPSAARSA
jgi:hypothetical protein